MRLAWVVCIWYICLHWFTCELALFACNRKNIQITIRMGWWMRATSNICSNKTNKMFVFIWICARYRTKQITPLQKEQTSDLTRLVIIWFDCAERMPMQIHSISVWYTFDSLYLQLLINISLQWFPFPCSLMAGGSLYDVCNKIALICANTCEIHYPSLHERSCNFHGNIGWDWFVFCFLDRR